MHALTKMTSSSADRYRLLTNSLRTLPDFIINGTQRGGTTSLYHYLSNHPQIAVASRKEVHFFDNNYHRGIGWYRAQFPTHIQLHIEERLSKQNCITGEASPYYLFHPHAPARAAQLVPRAKLIVLLRNPVERAYSHYYHGVEMGYETLSFDEALAQEEIRTRDEGQKLASDPSYYSYNHQYYTYRARGIYADQLEAWMNYFPREQFLIIQSEVFYASPTQVLQDIYAFLGVPTPPGDATTEYKQLNSSKYSQKKMDGKTRESLVAYFKPHNERLYSLLGRDFEWN